MIFDMTDEQRISRMVKTAISCYFHHSRQAENEKMVRDLYLQFRKDGINRVRAMSKAIEEVRELSEKI